MMKAVVMFLALAALCAGADLWIVLYDETNKVSDSNWTTSGSYAVTLTSGTLATSSYPVSERTYTMRREFKNRADAVRFIKGLSTTSESSRKISGVLLIHGESIPVVAVTETEEVPQPPVVKSKTRFEVK